MPYPIQLKPQPAPARSAGRRSARLRRQRRRQRERVLAALLAIGSTYGAVWCVQTGLTQPSVFGCLAFSCCLGFTAALAP